MPDMYKNGHMKQQLTPPAATMAVMSGTTSLLASTSTLARPHKGGSNGMCNDASINSPNSPNYYPEYSMTILAFSSVFGGVSMATGTSDTSGLLRDDDDRI